MIITLQVLTHPAVRPVFCPIAPGDLLSNRKEEIVNQAQAPREFVRVSEGGLGVTTLHSPMLKREPMQSAERGAAGPGIAVNLHTSPALFVCRVGDVFWSLLLWMLQHVDDLLSHFRFHQVSMKPFNALSMKQEVDASTHTKDGGYSNIAINASEGGAIDGLLIRARQGYLQFDTNIVICDNKLSLLAAGTNEFCHNINPFANLIEVIVNM